MHRNIEDFLKANGFYYDRKKNYYKNQGMPVAKIISIPYMAQAMMAITLLKPDSARARPSTLLNSEKEYRRIFSLDTPIDVFLKVVQIMKAVENFLKQNVCGVELERKDITNIKFYVAMLVGIALTEGKGDIVNKLAALPKVDIQNSVLIEALNKTNNKFQELGSTDQIPESVTPSARPPLSGLPGAIVSLAG